MTFAVVVLSTLDVASVTTFSLVAVVVMSKKLSSHFSTISIADSSETIYFHEKNVRLETTILSELKSS